MCTMVVKQFEIFNKSNKNVYICNYYKIELNDCIVL